MDHLSSDGTKKQLAHATKSPRAHHNLVGVDLLCDSVDRLADRPEFRPYLEFHSGLFAGLDRETQCTGGPPCCEFVLVRCRGVYF
jgi:hypothetical protein